MFCQRNPKDGKIRSFVRQSIVLTCIEFPNGTAVDGQPFDNNFLGACPVDVVQRQHEERVAGWKLSASPWIFGHDNEMSVIVLVVIPNAPI
jgi:hypothetical protein